MTDQVLEYQSTVPRATNRSGAEALKGVFRHPRVWRSIALQFGGLGVFALVIFESMSPDSWGWLGFICVAGLVIAVPSVVLALRDGAKRAITDHFLVVVGAFALYFLFGPLLLVIGPEEQAAYSMSWYPSDARAAVLVTSMNLMGLSILLYAAGFVPANVFERLIAPIDSLLGRLPAQKVFWAFLVIGGYCTYEVVRFDLSGSSELLSGLFRTLSQTLTIAILIGSMYRGRGAIFIRIAALLVALFSSVMGLLLLNKSAFLYPWLIVLFGTYLRRPSMRWVALTVLIFALALVALTKPIGEARNLVGTSLDLESRVTVLQAVFLPDAEEGAEDYGSGAWSRLCYTVPQIAAVDLYDRGLGGNDLELVGWVLLPRALFPEKPVITRSGPDFTAKVTGNETSSTGMGLFVNGYYNGGWVGLVITSALAGVLLAIYAAVSRAVVASGSMLLLPVALLGAFTGFRVDGHFLSDIWGSFAMVMVPLLLVGMVMRPEMRGKVQARQS